MSARKRSSIQERMARHADTTPTPASTSVRADDALKYALALFGERTEWVHSEIGACESDNGHDVSYLDDSLCAVKELVMQFGDQRRYSDGRWVQTSASVVKGLHIEHIWHPDPSQEKRKTWCGKLLGDPGMSCPGHYVAMTDPATQQIHVTVAHNT